MKWLTTSSRSILRNIIIIIMTDFTHLTPFKTKSGWHARLLGVLDCPTFPLVVAVCNPYFGGKEQLVTYAFDGRCPTTICDVCSPLTEADQDDEDVGCIDGALSLVNIEVPDDVIPFNIAWG